MESRRSSSSSSDGEVERALCFGRGSSSESLSELDMSLALILAPTSVWSAVALCASAAPADLRFLLVCSFFLAHSFFLFVSFFYRKACAALGDSSSACLAL